MLPLIPVWPCSLLEHFRVQYVVVGILVIAATAALRQRGWFDAAMLSTLVTLCMIVPGLGGSPTPGPAGGVPVRILALNVHTSNSQHDLVRRLIQDVDADVIALLEVDQRWLDALAPTLASYRGRVEQARSDNFGIALYARGELAGEIRLLGSQLPSVVAVVAVGAARIDVVVTHPLPPVSSDAQDALVAQLDAIASVAARLAAPVVVIGDLNATPWSRPFVRLTEAAGLCDSRAGFGLQATFPASSAILRIPIDHVLTSCDVGVRARRVERDVGSDHLPVVVDLVVPVRR